MSNQIMRVNRPRSGQAYYGKRYVPTKSGRGVSLAEECYVFLEWGVTQKGRKKLCIMMKDNEPCELEPVAIGSSKGSWWKFWTRKPASWIDSVGGDS